MGHPNETLVRDLYDAFATRDMAAIDRLLADDVTWWAPGTGQHAGLRRGKAELGAAMGRLADLTGGTLRSEIVDVMAGDRRVAVLQVTRAERAGVAPLVDEEVVLFQIEDGRIAAVREHPGDQRAMDAFFESGRR